MFFIASKQGTSMKNSAKYLPTETSYKKCIFVVLLVIFIYIFDNSFLRSYIDGWIYTYVLKPLLWIIITFTIWRMPQIRPAAKLRHKKDIYFWAFIFGTIFVVINVFAGFFDGLGKSPYSHSFTGIFTNLIYVGSALVAREFVRSYLVNSITKKENYFIFFILIALLMTTTNFSTNKYMGLKNLESSVQFIAEYFAPEFSHNLFAVYLVYLGGPIASIIYLTVIQGFHWLSPILPSLKWINTALVGILSPIFFLMSFNSIYSNITKQKKIKENEDILSWIITSIISIIIIWFAVGVFPIYPSVIITGSMEPEIKPGDIILVKKITNMEDINNLKINDVIQFQRDGILISHRIIDIKDDDKEGIQFKTKGDNNSAADSDLVKPPDIKGTIKHTVPKLGWLTLLMRSTNEISIDEVVF